MGIPAASEFPFLANGGEMGALIRAHDWSRSPLGSPASWPQSLRSIVGLMLHSKFSMFVAWGPELGFLYNDAYLEILGAKHPAALGRPLRDIWPEVWDNIRPIIEQAMQGHASYHENLPLTVNRKGYDEDVWFTFSYSPVHEESGQVAGMFCAVTETTEQVLAERHRAEEVERLRYLFQQAPGIIAVLRGSNHIFEIANDSYLELIGHRGILGKPVREALPEVAGQGFFELLDRVYRTGEPYIGHENLVKLRRRRDGPLEERFVDFVYQPTVDHRGNITGIFVEGSDVTEAVKAHRALRESEQQAQHAMFLAEDRERRINAMLEATPVGLVYATGNGKLMVLNAECVRIWGNPPMSEKVDDYAEWKGWFADGSQRHGERLAAHEWPMARALNGETVVDAVVEIEPFGQPDVRRTLLLRAVPIHDHSGKVTGAITAQMDITEQEAARRTIAESDFRIQQLANSIPQLAWMANPDGFIHWYNDRWYDYTGMTPKEMDGWGWQSVHDPQVLPIVLDKWNHSIATGTSFEMTFPLRGRDGVYRSFYTLIEPLKDADGKVLQWFGTNTDVSALQQTQEQLRRTEQWLQDSLRTGNMVAYEWNLKTKEVKYSANAVAVLGHAERSLEKGLEAISPEDRQHLEAEVSHAIQERQTFDVLTRRVRPDNGRQIWIRAMGRILTDRQDEPHCARGILADVTEQITKENELQEANRRKDEFLAMLAHELRNPLAPISTAAQLLSMGLADAKRVAMSSEIIERQVNHMTELIDDLLDVSRVTRGLIQLEKQPVDIKTVITIAIEQTRPLIESRNHDLTIHMGSAHSLVLGDKTRLVQVVSNLLSNAAKYTPEGGEIALAVETKGSTVQIGVQDDGNGIEPSLLPYIFDLFTQGKRTPDRSQGGLGLGLALVKSLLELHHGSITAESGGPGKGSAFTITLPLHQGEDVVSDGAAAKAGTGPADKPPLAVMVVDDNVDAANMLGELLKAEGHQVSVCYGAKAALQAAIEQAPQVCILDIGLPEMDGYELARRLRGSPRTAKTTLIALSGYGQAHDKVLAKSAGFSHHFVKPLSIKMLLPILDSIG